MSYRQPKLGLASELRQRTVVKSRAISPGTRVTRHSGTWMALASLTGLVRAAAEFAQDAPDSQSMIRLSHDMEAESLYGTRPPRGRRPANGDQPAMLVDIDSVGPTGSLRTASRDHQSTRCYVRGHRTPLDRTRRPTGREGGRELSYETQIGSAVTIVIRRRRRVSAGGPTTVHRTGRGGSHPGWHRSTGSLRSRRP